MNMLFKGYLVERKDGTKEHYIDWNKDDIASLEAAYHGNQPYEIISTTYEIENGFLKWEYTADGVFREYNEGLDEFLEIESKQDIAKHLWKMATESDEEDVRAVYLMAVDIVGSFQTWRDQALIATLKEFDADERFIRDQI